VGTENFRGSFEMTEKERYWEVWSKDHVDRLEKEVWGTPGIHPRGRHHELVMRHIALIPYNTKTILEVGCGMGSLYAEIREKPYIYLGLDTSLGMVEKFKDLFSEANVRYGDVFNLENEPMVDCVICEDVLMHLPGDLIVPLKQLWSRVKRGGALIVSMRMTEGDNPSWLIEREYIPMPNKFATLPADKKLIIRAINHKELESKIQSFEPAPEYLKEHFYDERTSIYEVKKQ
jgi:SAM-dependent methyltransferase